jgi:hypothetical protein
LHAQAPSAQVQPALSVPAPFVPTLFVPALLVDWQTISPLLQEFWNLVKPRVIPRHRAGRLKQWLNLMRRCYPEAQTMFAALRTMNDSATVERTLIELLRAEKLVGLQADLQADQRSDFQTLGASRIKRESVDSATVA